jgi:acyl CoA:acetate/3-ketoacid CoA transferase
MTWPRSSHIDGREYLRFKPYRVDVALVRASAADEDGNISFEHEAANLDAVAHRPGRASSQRRSR